MKKRLFFLLICCSMLLTTGCRNTATDSRNAASETVSTPPNKSEITIQEQTVIKEMVQEIPLYITDFEIVAPAITTESTYTTGSFQENMNAELDGKMPVWLGKKGNLTLKAPYGLPKIQPWQ